MILRSQFVLFCSLFLFSCEISSHRLRSYRRFRRDVVAEEGLYASDSKVVILNSTNFNSIFGTKNAWLVEFYATWCGHCQRFAPSYTALAKDVVGWKAVIKIAAVDCASSINSAVCRENDIQHYPAIMFFHDHSQKGYKGMEITKGKTPEETRRSIVKLLIKEQEEAGRGESWPTLVAYKNGSPRDLWASVPSSVKYQVVIYEDENSLLGAEMVLDLHKTKDVRVKRIIYEKSDLRTDEGTAPSAVVIERNEEADTLDITGSSRESFFKAIKSYLSSKGIRVPTGDEDIPSSNEDSNNPKDTGTDQTEYRTDVLYQADLENAVQYSFKQEIAVQKAIQGESLVALKNYLNVLVKYFPIGVSGVKLFENLRDWVSRQDSIKGQEFLDNMEILEEEMKPVFRSKSEWLGCKGSSTKYRGYPCGLWTLFHTLTTNAVLQDGNSKSFNSLEVLEAMVGYIKHYFGCLECSQHFQEMAEHSLHGNVTKPNDGILWLWRAHNTVNKRLAGDVTEDPKHPKIQFPSKKSCPSCRNGKGAWTDNQVLIFLKKMYGKENINYSGWEKPESLPPPQDHTKNGNEDGTSGSSGWAKLSIPLMLAGLALFSLLVYLKIV